MLPRESKAPQERMEASRGHFLPLRLGHQKGPVGEGAPRKDLGGEAASGCDEGPARGLGAMSPPRPAAQSVHCPGPDVLKAPSPRTARGTTVRRQTLAGPRPRGAWVSLDETR